MSHFAIVGGGSKDLLRAKKIIYTFLYWSLAQYKGQAGGENVMELGAVQARRYAAEVKGSKAKSKDRLAGTGDHDLG